ncbi:MAG: SPASM domain-containing protein, partial [Legionellales bacterium]|nr:SPASM domain-containing protein [Legionellales bacterium]
LSTIYPIDIELPREKYLNNNTHLRCSAGFKTIYIAPNMKVYPCPFISANYELGNLNLVDMKHIIKTHSFSVDNTDCIKCPAMNPSHNITKNKLI